MGNVMNFNEFVNESLNEENKKETTKSKALDFVETKGSATWKEIHTFLMNHKGMDPSDTTNRGNMSSYFSGASSWQRKDTTAVHGRHGNKYGLLMIPTKQDPRYLEKDGKKYVVKIWDGKSNIA